MTLAETEALFHQAITRGDADPSAIEACFAGTPTLPAAARLEIYAGMWFWRQVEALQAEFPALHACLGAERFTALATDYLRAHPSAHHDIGRLGRHLAAFLRDHPAPDRTDLGDLAALEWARSEVFFEADGAAVDREAVRSLAPEAFGAARLRFVAALRLLPLAHPAHEVWEGALHGASAVPAQPAPACLAVWRSGAEVRHASLAPAEGAALAAAGRGATLLEVCTRFAEEEEPAAAAFAAVASWIDAGWVAGVEAERPG